MKSRLPASTLPKRKPSLGEIVAVLFCVFFVVPVLFSAIGVVAYAAQDVRAVWALNVIIIATTAFFIFFFLQGLHLAVRLIRLIDRR